jgi:hypothetical protein
VEQIVVEFLESPQTGNDRAQIIEGGLVVLFQLYPDVQLR